MCYYFVEFAMLTSVPNVQSCLDAGTKKNIYAMTYIFIKNDFENTTCLVKVQGPGPAAGTPEGAETVVATETGVSVGKPAPTLSGTLPEGAGVSGVCGVSGIFGVFPVFSFFPTSMGSTLCSVNPSTSDSFTLPEPDEVTGGSCSFSSSSSPSSPSPSSSQASSSLEGSIAT